MIHKEGKKIVAYSLAFCIVVSGLLFRMAPTISYFVIPTIWILFFFIAYFFRNPERSTPKVSKGTILAPADGKVVNIEEVYENEYLQQECKLISIFMSPMNVHINWNPVDGQLVYYKYHSGKYLVAWHPKSSTDNERTTSVIETENGQKVLVRQIAGAMARRIINYHEVDQKVQKGTEFGFIRFGSRVDIYLPLSAKINCHLDQKVQGKLSSIAELSI
jgi:phosphatidylserine decarboxylase